MLVTISREAARFVRTALHGPPKWALDAVRRAIIANDRYHVRCTLAEASALREWLHAQAEAATRPATAEVLAQAAEDVDEAIALDRQ